MFIHDFAEVQLSLGALGNELSDLPELLSRLVGPAFDQTMTSGSAPWPVSYGPPRRRDDGWVYPVWWPGGRGGLVPAVDADLGFFPSSDGTCHLEIMGTYTPSQRRLPADRTRRAHLQTVMGVRRLVQSLAAGLGDADPIPVGPARFEPGPAP
jgi:hypothetical protein